LIDSLLDSVYPDVVFRLAGLASAAKARLVVATHSPWIRKAFQCHRCVAEAPVADKPVTAYEFVEGEIREVGLVSETYGKVFGRLYEICG
jgi:predicted ATPase